MMKLINDDKSDISNEVMVQLAMVLECVYASEIVCYRMAELLDKIAVRNTFFQQKKFCLNRARRNMQQVIRDLEVAFDQTFIDISEKEPDEVVDRTDYMSALANEVLRLLLVAFSRSNGSLEKMKTMTKTLHNYKAVVGIDIDEMLNVYKLKL